MTIQANTGVKGHNTLYQEDESGLRLRHYSYITG